MSNYLFQLYLKMLIRGGLEACQWIVEHDNMAFVVFVMAHDVTEFKADATTNRSWDSFSEPFRLSDIYELLDRVVASCGKSHHESFLALMDGTVGNHNGTSSAALGASSLFPLSRGKDSFSRLHKKLLVLLARPSQPIHHKHLFQPQRMLS